MRLKGVLEELKEEVKVMNKSKKNSIFQAWKADQN